MTNPKFKQNLIEAYRKARKSIVNYRRIMLSCGDNEVESADYHYRWSDLLLNYSGNEAIQGFRESGKTNLVLRAFFLYALTFPNSHRDYIVIIKKNTTLAENKLKELETEYTTNPAISANCVKIREQSSSVFSVDVKNEHDEIVNVRIEAYGKGASIRGLANLDRRPKIVVVDDPQDIEDAKSETVQASDWDWFLSDVMFLGQHTRIFLIGNNLGEKSIIERIFANAKELKFHTERVPAETDGVSAWGAKYTIDSIYEEKENYRKLGKLDIWQREKMCIATSEETRVFKREDRRYFVARLAEKISRDCNIAFTIDPATSKDKTSCFRAIVINAIDSDNKWNILDVKYGRWNADELLDILFTEVKRWKPNLGVGIEKGMFKQIIEPFIYKEMSRRNIFFDIKPIEHAKVGSKLERVKMLAPRFRAHNIWFPDRADWLLEMESELDGVVKDGFKSLFVDLVDALAMQEQIADAPFGNMSEKDLPRTAMADDTAKVVLDTIGSFERSNLPRSVEMETVL